MGGLSFSWGGDLRAPYKPWHDFMIFPPNIVSIEHITFKYLSFYNPTTNGILQLKVEKLNLFGRKFPKRVQMV